MVSSLNNFQAVLISGSVLEVWQYISVKMLQGSGHFNFGGGVIDYFGGGGVFL